MASDTPTDPGGIPSASGIVHTGKQPDPFAGAKEVAHSAIEQLQEQWGKKSTRDLLANALYWLVGKLVPGSAQSILLQQLKPVIITILETGSK